jgi:carbon monoxide dehydrogenase subunit G
LAFFVSTTLEVVEFSPPRRLVSRSTEGVRSVTTWALETVTNGTLVRYSGEYQLPFGMRLLGDRVVEQVVSTQVRASLANLNRIFTSEHPKC